MNVHIHNYVCIYLFFSLYLKYKEILFLFIISLKIFFSIYKERLIKDMIRDNFNIAKLLLKTDMFVTLYFVYAIVI